MPRILYVHHTAVLGGAERSLLTLLAALDTRRYRPLALLPGPGPLADTLKALDVPVRFAPLRRLRMPKCPVAALAVAASLARAAASTARVIARERPDVIHAGSLNSLAAVAPAARHLGARTLWHVRDLARRPALEVPLGPLTDALVAISRAVMDTLGHVRTRRPLRRVIHNAIDAPAFAAAARPGELRARLGLSPRHVLIAAAAQFVPWKGLGSLLDAFALLAAANSDARLAIAGSDLFGDHPDLSRALRARAERPDLAGRVTFLGPLPDVATLFADADLVAVPSRAEPFGRVALEAMALAKPVVGTRAGGLPEIVTHGETGLLVAPGDAPALAAALTRLARDKPLRARLGRAAHDRLDAFRPADHARRIEAVYEALLAPRSEQGRGAAP